ncbi:MAG: hypothetical protein Q9219_007639, partial [cf. Caloplaca sp. 3 TL-2023]
MLQLVPNHQFSREVEDDQYHFGIPFSSISYILAAVTILTHGGLYNSNNSRTWNDRRYFELDLETNLYPPEDANYGLDTVALGFTNATGGPVLENQVVAALSGSEYSLGNFGLGQEPTNFTNFTNSYPSFLTSLYNKQLIPSLSWSYTAGARYRLKGVFGSLTLGGLDAARFHPNNVSFDLASDISRDLVVGMQSITSKESNGSTHLLLPSPHFTFLDSTIPYIYLPLEACELFERVYGLVWNTTYKMYIVDDALHDDLATRNPDFRFEIGNSMTGGPTIEIKLPYVSFDLSYQPKVGSDPIRYFPIQRAANDTQLTLGRAFLQEAYLTTDYERRNFSVSQCKFEEPVEGDMVQDIVPILAKNLNATLDSAPRPPLSTSNRLDQSTRLSRQKIIGISVGATLGFLLLLALCCWPCIARFRNRRRNPDNTRAIISSAQDIQNTFKGHENPFRTPVNQSSSSLKSLVKYYETVVPEISTNSWNFLREAPNSGKAELPDNAVIPELSYHVDSATPGRPRPQTYTGSGRRTSIPLNPRNRYGLVLSTSSASSPGNIIKHFMQLSGLRGSYGESLKSTEVP